MAGGEAAGAAVVEALSVAEAVLGLAGPGLGADLVLVLRHRHVVGEQRGGLGHVAQVALTILTLI